MNLQINPEEKDFFRAIGITKEDEETFALFKKMYYSELTQMFQSKKAEGKLNSFQLKKFALEISTHSKMLHSGLSWFKEHKREDQLIVLLLGEIFFKLATSDSANKKRELLSRKGLVS